MAAARSASLSSVSALRSSSAARSPLTCTCPGIRCPPPRAPPRSSRPPPAPSACRAGRAPPPPRPVRAPPPAAPARVRPAPPLSAPPPPRAQGPPCCPRHPPAPPGGRLRNLAARLVPGHQQGAGVEDRAVGAGDDADEQREHETADGVPAEQ